MTSITPLLSDAMTSALTHLKDSIDWAPPIVESSMPMVDIAGMLESWLESLRTTAPTPPSIWAIVRDKDRIVGIVSLPSLLNRGASAQSEESRSCISAPDIAPVSVLNYGQLEQPSTLVKLWQERGWDCLPIVDPSSVRMGLLSRGRWMEAIAMEVLERPSLYTSGDLSDVEPESNSERAKRAQLLAEFSSDLLACLAPDNTYTYASTACIHLLGYQPEELYGRNFFELFHPEDRAAWEGTIAAVGRLPDTYTLRYRVRRQNDGYIWLETKSRVIRDRAGNPREIALVSRDITERKQAEAELRRYEAHLEQLVEERTRELTTANQHLTREIEHREQVERNLFREKELAQITLRSIGDGVIATNARGQIDYLNPIAEQWTGWSNAEAKGKLLPDVFQLVDETTRQPMENPVTQVMREGTIAGMTEQTLLIARDGSERAVEDSIAPIRDSAGHPIGTVLVFRDVTQSRQLARQLSWQATHDELTGLLNRRAFERQLDIAITGARDRGDRHILCFFDLDRFKVVNDTCGHAAGDELLRQIADLLRQQVRASDVVARLGGDEFGLLLYRCPIDMARRIASSLNQELQAMKFAWEDHIFSASASLGLVTIDADSRNLVTTLRQADAACYAAKHGGRSRIHIYQPSDRLRSQHNDQRQWLARIQHALEENRLCLFAHPILPVTQGRPSKIQTPVEVLLRLVDEEEHLVLPMAFIPAAERYNLTPDLDRWVLRTLISHFHAGGDAEASPSRDRSLYMVNLAGASLHDESFLDFVRTQLQTRATIPNVCFAMSETAVIANLSQASRFIRELQPLGCKFALDDFGSGMSSFSYLKQLPVDYIKIDCNTIRAIATDPFARAVTHSIAHIARVLNIQTIAAGVETEATLKALEDIGVDFAQGYAGAEPTPLVLTSYEP